MRWEVPASAVISLMLTIHPKKAIQGKGGRREGSEKTIHGLDLGGLTVAARPILQHSEIHFGTTDGHGIKHNSLFAIEWHKLKQSVSNYQRPH